MHRDLNCWITVGKKKSSPCNVMPGMGEGAKRTGPHSNWGHSAVLHKDPSRKGEEGAIELTQGAAI